MDNEIWFWFLLIVSFYIVFLSRRSSINYQELGEQRITKGLCGDCGKDKGTNTYRCNGCNLKYLAWITSL
jgi:hypothetical protein